MKEYVWFSPELMEFGEVSILTAWGGGSKIVAVIRGQDGSMKELTFYCLGEL